MLQVLSSFDWAFTRFGLFERSPDLNDHQQRLYAPRLASTVVQPIGLRKTGYDTLVCFSHLRWDFVFQRPQHLMTRFARARKVVFWEEPLPGPSVGLDRRVCPHSGVVIVTPMLPEGLGVDERNATLQSLLDDALASAQGDLIR